MLQTLQQLEILQARRVVVEQQVRLQVVVRIKYRQKAQSMILPAVVVLPRTLVRLPPQIQTFSMLQVPVFLWNLWILLRSWAVSLFARFPFKDPEPVYLMALKTPVPRSLSSISVILLQTQLVQY